MKSVKSTFKSSLFHEVNSAGQHRIVKIVEGGSVKSEWFEHHQIAVLGNLRACVRGNDALPTGLFRVIEVEGSRL